MCFDGLDENLDLQKKNSIDFVNLIIVSLIMSFKHI